MFHHGIRQRLEDREEGLSPYAARSRLSSGRVRHEEPCPVRTSFQRDRDRIIHSKSFRRLMHKTQVFIAPMGDHYVTRLTHTLQVSQIARTIARALNLNEDLAEAVALGHDLGHPPFGHAGEELLDHICPGGFRHNEQSLRVVERLENDGQGLNLTWEVRDGILKHSKPRSGILSQEGMVADTLEGQICKVADAVAYINHDLDDAIRAGIIGEEDIPAEVKKSLGTSHRERINTLVCDIIDHSWAATGIAEVEGKPMIVMSGDIQQKADLLRDFLFRRVYCHESLEARHEEARQVLRALYEYYYANPERLEIKYRPQKGDVERAVLDYISGMTDRYAWEIFNRLNLPSLKVS